MVKEPSVMAPEGPRRDASARRMSAEIYRLQFDVLAIGIVAGVLDDFSIFSRSADCHG